MTTELLDVFADTVFWIGLVNKSDQYADRAKSWSQKILGKIITTDAVLTETANALARPEWRSYVIDLIENLRQNDGVEIVQVDADLWEDAWKLYQQRQDKGWGLTDCISFVVMNQMGLSDALTADDHFRQAGFRAVLLEEPT